jgi:hypothetical protein
MFCLQLTLQVACLVPRRGAAVRIFRTQPGPADSAGRLGSLLPRSAADTPARKQPDLRPDRDTIAIDVQAGLGFSSEPFELW